MQPDVRQLANRTFLIANEVLVRSRRRRKNVMTPEGSLRLLFARYCPLIAMIACCAPTASLAQDKPDAKQQQRERLLAQMRTLAQDTQVRFQAGERPPQLLASPVFRYDDQPRHFLDATMWAWTDRGRPVAFEKIEAMAQAEPQWGHCFASASESLLAVQWAGGREYRSTAPGADFRPLPDAPDVPASNAARKRALRKLAGNFSARILTDLATNTSETMRLLPTPIFEYSEPETKELLGAVFGLATSGTNPDVLILLEARGEQDELAWHYAVARMTIGGVTLKYRDAEVWRVEYHPPQPTAFPTWTFFFTPRNQTSETEPVE